MKVKCVISGHQWSGCLCERCGETRDTDHVWTPDPQDPCKFLCRCGLQKFMHEWVNGVCKRCNTLGIVFDPPTSADSAPSVSGTLKEILARQQKQSDQRPEP
jgi:hypothetical protein